jgi:nitroimidazol reductase NimA-like FMN-containing flavoprotein (pyridoxamine 5'-phosphate oxidase superfamily)
MSDVEEPVSELSVEECWSLLESHEFGRLAYRLVDEVHLVPINYATENRILYFRTASGSKLFAAALKSDVAFEIDWYDESTAWSVLARGRLRQLEEDEQSRIRSLGARSWIPTDKPEVIELLPDVVSGRRFVLQRPEPGREILR